MAQKTGQKFLNKYVEEWENNVEKGLYLFSSN